MVLLLDLAEALNQLRLLLLVTGRCALVIELFELPLELFELRLKYDLGRIAKIVAVQKHSILVLSRSPLENATRFQCFLGLGTGNRSRFFSTK